MKREYDFSNAERGKFFRADAELQAPIHLEPKVAAWVATRAKASGKSVNTLVNDLLKKDIELVEAAECER